MFVDVVLWQLLSPKVSIYGVQALKSINCMFNSISQFIITNPRGYHYSLKKDGIEYCRAKNVVVL